MTISVDANDMRSAIPQVEHLITLLDGAARSLYGITLPSGVPGGVAAQVTHTVETSARGLRSSANTLHPIPDDLRRRAAAAAIAAEPWMIATGWSMSLLGLYNRAFSIRTLSKSMTWGMAARDIRGGLASGETYAGGKWQAFRLTSAAAKDAGITRGVPSTLSKISKYGGKGLTGASWALTAYNSFRNPNLSTEQKIGRTGAHIATGTGVSVLAGGATGAAFGAEAGPAGMLIGFGAGTAWTLLDSRFHVSDKIGDAAADTADAVGDAAGDVAHGAKSLGDKALGVVGL